MNTVRNLNESTENAVESSPNQPAASGRLEIAEKHAKACWAVLERHVGEPRCQYGCYKHEQAGHVVIVRACEVGDACREEYEIASRRVREIQAAQCELEPGDMRSTLEQSLDALEKCLSENKEMNS